MLNFAALGLGGLFTGGGVASDWYAELDKAPWTPPGWVFGFAWTTIMVCFAFYMAALFKKEQHKKTVVLLFGVQWILNVSWNPAFFYFQNALVGMVIIVGLTSLVAFLFFKFLNPLKGWSLLIAPYLLWLLIATSLNGYILFNN